MFPILNPPPSSLPTPSLWVVPVHQPQVSSIVHRTWTGDSFHIWYYTYFNAILPNHPTLSLSHRVQNTVLYKASLLLSRIQGYCYRLSKSHIYALVYCSGVFLCSWFWNGFPSVSVSMSHKLQFWRVMDASDWTSLGLVPVCPPQPPVHFIKCVPSEP